MITALKVFVFAAMGCLALRAAFWVRKATLDDDEKARMWALPNGYLFRNHKALVVMGALLLLCQAIAVVSLAVAAAMWAVGA